MFKNLTQREKAVIALGAVALVVMLIVFGGIMPYRSTIGSLDQRIENQQRQLKEIREMQAELQRLQLDVELKERKLANSSGTSAFSAIEGIVSRLGFRDRLVAMRPQPAGEREGLRVEAVEARLEGITLEQLVGLLNAFDTSPILLNVSSMQVRTRFDNASLLDSELRIETLKQGG